MKIYIILITFAALMFAGCSSPSAKEDESLKQEVLLNDSIAVEVEKVSEDIQESISKLDSLINEL